MRKAEHKAEQGRVNSKRGSKARADGGGKRLPRRITSTYLQNAGLFYLQRFSASKAHFKRVLMRKVKRSCDAHEDQDIDSCRAMVDALADRFEETGLLNDAVYARGLADSLRRRGRSRKVISAKLSEKGLRGEQISGALEALGEESGLDERQAEYQAALRFARRKRIGLFRVGESGPDLQRKDLGAFARAGFSYDIARSVLDHDGEDDLF